MGTKKTKTKNPSNEPGTEPGTEPGIEPETEPAAIIPEDIDPFCRQKMLSFVAEHTQDGKKMRQCGQWIDFIPDEHDVGLTFGAGEFVEKISVPQEPGQEDFVYWHRFVLDDIYENLKRENDRTNYRPLGLSHSAQQPPMGGTGNNQPLAIIGSGSGQFQDAISLIREIAPLFKQENDLDRLGKFGEVMAASMQRTLMEQLIFFKQLQKRIIPLLFSSLDDEEDDADNPDGKDNPDMNAAAIAAMPESVLITTAKAMLPKLLPQLASYALRLLDPDPAKSEVIIQKLKQFGVLEMFGNPALSNDMKTTVAFLDSQITAEKVTMALAKLGVDANKYRG